MKRSLAILFVCALLISALTACGCSASPQNDAPQNDSAAQNSGDTQNGGGTQSNSGAQNDSAVIGGDTSTDSGVTPDHTTPDVVYALPYCAEEAIAEDPNSFPYNDGELGWT